jgi:integrase
MNSSIHFNIRTDRPKKDGSVQIVLFFTLNRNQRLKISLGKYVSLKKEYNYTLNKENLVCNKNKELFYYWDSLKERATKGTENWQEINDYLDNEKARANKILLQHELMNKPITISSFKRAFLKPNGINDFKEYFINEITSKRKHLMAHDTYQAYMSAINKVTKFKPNLSLADIDYKFLSQFENYMLKPINEGGLGNIPYTISKTMKMIRALIIIAIKNGDFLGEAYPFKDFKIKHIDPVLTTRDYLEPDDLIKVEQLLSIEKINELTEGEIKATKRFLFACYTGLRFSDVNSLRKSSHIFGKYILNPNSKEMVYKYYIELSVSKTSRPVFIPLIDKAIDLINDSNSDLVFEKISNQKINKHLKSINNKLN